MKRFYCLLSVVMLFTVAVVTACNDDEDVVNAAIVGKWYLETTSNDNLGQTEYRIEIISIKSDGKTAWTHCFKLGGSYVVYVDLGTLRGSNGILVMNRDGNKESVTYSVSGSGDGKTFTLDGTTYKLLTDEVRPHLESILSKQTGFEWQMLDYN